MGIQLVLTGLSAIVSVVGGIAQASAAADAAASQRESNAIDAAMQQTASADSRRQKVREERIRRAQIIASAENTGTTGSSGAAGAVGALGTNLAGLFGKSLGESKGNAGINRNNQAAADSNALGNQIGAWTDTINAGISGFQSIFDDPTITGAR